MSMTESTVTVPAAHSPFGTAPHGPGVLAPGSRAQDAHSQAAPMPPQVRPSGTLVARSASVTAEQFIREAMDIIDAARPMPLSTSVMINRDEVMTLLESALAAVPDETRQARWLLRERDEVLARARVDANLVIDEARSRVAQMVQRTEVVRTAERRARQLLDDALIQTRRRRHEVDEYCERQLAQFESAVDQLQTAVQAARRKLAKRSAAPVAPSVPPERPGTEAEGAPADGPAARGADTRPVVFDQDRT
ncbi:hypothetical protein [Candidatus Poriferisodalis sp.]|uniref:hypothetical protein n=1 Tax=Candidatus Poriferisodalis sp. TaxID=3101277 RepID=UPI003B020EAB